LKGEFCFQSSKREREKGRKGEREKGRKGEREKGRGRKGEREKRCKPLVDIFILIIL